MASVVAFAFKKGLMVVICVEIFLHCGASLLMKGLHVIAIDAIDATHWLMSTQVVMDVVPDVEMVRSGLDYSMHGMLAHNADDDDTKPKVSKTRGPEKTEEMDGSGAKVGIRLDP